MRFKAQQYLKALSDKIHPQLPLGNRESTQLLQLLKSSFRKELDKKHPVSLPTEEKETTSGAKPLLNRDSKLLNSSRLATAHHLETILNHPLFIETGKPTASPATAIGAASADDGYKAAKRQFNTHVANGTADQQNATVFLEKINALACSFVPSAADRKRRLADSGAGSIVRQWLWSSGMDAFPTARRLANYLVRHLVAEGQQEFLWTSISRTLQSPDEAQDLEHVEFGKWLIYRLMLAEKEFNTGLDSAIESFLDGLNEFVPKPPVSSRLQALFRPGGVFITDCIVNGDSVSEANFTRWLANLERWSSLASYSRWTRLDVHRARLLAAHPQRPDAMPAYELVCGKDGDAPCGPRTQRRLQQLCLTSTEILLAQGKNHEAKKMVEFMLRLLTEEHASGDSAKEQPQLSSKHEAEQQQQQQELKTKDPGTRADEERLAPSIRRLLAAT